MIRNFVLGLGACAIAIASGCGKAPIVAPSGQSAEIKEKVRSVEVVKGVNANDGEIKKNVVEAAPKIEEKVKVLAAQNPLPDLNIQPNTPEAAKRVKDIQFELQSLEAKSALLKKELMRLQPVVDLKADADPVKFDDRGAAMEGGTFYITKGTKFVSYDAESKIITISQARGPNRSFLVSDTCVSRVDTKPSELKYLKKGDSTTVAYEKNSKLVAYTWTYINTFER